MSNAANPQYPICDALRGNASRHCAALVITKDIVQDERGLPSLAQPSEILRNGTVTFVKTQNRVYGITCWHVVKYYRELDQRELYTMRTMVNGFFIVLDRFIRPKHGIPQIELDIALRELHPDFPAALGKTFLDLDASPPLPSQIQHAYAVGFPEGLKYKKFEDPFGYRVAMPQQEILAEIDSLPTQRFSLFSELPEPPKDVDFSGMSGGPIFWSTVNEYGILGIIYETACGTGLLGPNSVHVSGELATSAVVQSWVAQVPLLYP